MGKPTNHGGDIDMDNTSQKVDTPEAAKQNQDSIQNEQTDTTKTSDTNPGNEAESSSDGGAVSSSSPACSDTSSNLDAPKREFPENLEKWEQSVDMEIVADEMARRIKMYCVLTDHEVDAIVLWLISSYLINSFRIFPKLALISPEKRCGKTTSMEVIESMSKDGLLVSNMSPAAIYRITGLLQPTLLIDEADTFVKNGDPQLVGLVNSSHNKRGATVIRCDGDDYSAKAHSTWMPMVLASIGDLPPTIMDRSIVVSLRRKNQSERVERLPEDLFDLCCPLRRKIFRWCLDNQTALKNNSIEPPDMGNDRAGDNWLPLFSVAHEIGGAWIGRCDAAYKCLTETPELELPTQLLADIREVWVGRKEQRISSESLVNTLCKDSTKPWPACNNGKKLTPNFVANLLKPYGIKPNTHRFNDGTKRGYERHQFAEAFDRYLPS